MWGLPPTGPTRSVNRCGAHLPRCRLRFRSSCKGSALRLRFALRLAAELPRLIYQEILTLLFVAKIGLQQTAAKMPTALQG
jgi:hypothetical protein